MAQPGRRGIRRWFAKPRFVVNVASQTPQRRRGVSVEGTSVAVAKQWWYEGRDRLHATRPKGPAVLHAAVADWALQLRRGREVDPQNIAVQHRLAWLHWDGGAVKTPMLRNQPVPKRTTQLTPAMKGPPLGRPESRAEVAEEGVVPGSQKGQEAWHRLARGPLAELGRAGSMSAGPAGSRTGRQQQGLAGPIGQGGGRRQAMRSRR
ncbi:hypothetical protein MRX96_025866 [Rhipicephalus microplus]